MIVVMMGRARVDVFTAGPCEERPCQSSTLSFVHMRNRSRRTRGDRLTKEVAEGVAVLLVERLSCTQQQHTFMTRDHARQVDVAVTTPQADHDGGGTFKCMVDFHVPNNIGRSFATFRLDIHVDEDEDDESTLVVRCEEDRLEVEPGHVVLGGFIERMVASLIDFVFVHRTSLNAIEEGGDGEPASESPTPKTR